MRSRMERHYGEDELPKRTVRNSDVYDEIYTLSKQPTSNVTVLDEANEIDINKIKEMMSNREDYRKAKKLDFILNDNKKEVIDRSYDIIDELEQRNYDINEILKNKRSNKDYEDGKNRVRKISDTQYDILKNLNIKRSSDSDEKIDEELQERELRTLIDNITKGSTNTSVEKATLDLFGSLKGENTNLTPPMKREMKNASNIENTFYSSSLNFKKEDFEDFDELKTSVKKNNIIVKLLIIFSILVVLGIGYLVFTQYIDLGALLK